MFVAGNENSHLSHRSDTVNYLKDHADQFSKISGKKSRELVNKLLKLEKMKVVIAVRIADILPQSRDEIRSIYAKEKYTLSNEELDQILDYISETME